MIFEADKFISDCNPFFVFLYLFSWAAKITHVQNQMFSLYISYGG